MGEDPRQPMELQGVPPAILAVIDRLVERRHAAVLVGGGVRSLIAGQISTDFDIATSASAEAVLEIFPRAVPIGLRHGTVMVPTPSGPVDVTQFRAGPRLEDDLALRDFTINAMAYDPRRRELLDLFEGRSDLAKGVLRAVGSARERLDEDPLRALRAARLQATLGFEVATGVETAMRNVASSLVKLPAERLRRELALLLLGVRARDALGLLRRTGIEERLAPGAAADAGRVIEALPLDLDVRLAGWLRGTRVFPILRRLRFPRRVTERVDHLLRLHPFEQSVRSLGGADVRRLIRRAGEHNVGTLLALRRAELETGEPDAAASAKLDALEDAIARAQRSGALALRRLDLALDGAAVMETLGCRPGPEVGRALRYLTECVIEDPECNTPERLCALLLEHAASGS